MDPQTSIWLFTNHLIYELLKLRLHDN